MPKFTSDQARESHQEKIAEICEWRRNVATELIWAVVPKAEKEGLPWKRLVVMACKYYDEHKEDIQRGDPMFEGHKDFFISPAHIYGYRADIRDKLIEQGKHLALAREKGRIVGLFGTKRKNAINSTFAFFRKVIEGSAERHNVRAETSNHKMQTELPGLAVRLSLPAPKE